jgi:pyridoxal phosphate enzyme (YggS family)
MCPTNQTPEQRFSNVIKRIRAACDRSGRDPDHVRLLAVSKTRPAGQIQDLARLGQRCFGENYVDEAVAKIAELGEQGLCWHFIGPVQSNKTRLLAEHFDWVESVDREKIVRRLADQRPEGKAALNVLIQVNLDDEKQKAGCAPDDIAHLADVIAARPELRLRGLMAIPAATDDHVAQRAVFARLQALYDTLAGTHPSVDTISAGMSGDLEAAIAEGSTEVRVGTDLFGPRG